MDRTLAVKPITKDLDDVGWALWDADGGHLGMDEIVEMRDKYGATIYFFRNENKQSLNLEQLKDRGLTLVKVAHPGYQPFKNRDFLADGDGIRAWAIEALANPSIDGLALDIEGPTASTGNNAFRILSEEAHKTGKTFHAVPHFSLFDRWDNTLTAREFNDSADVVWPWLYNRFKTPSYKQGIFAMLQYWKDNGVTVPTYPIFDHGREDYSGIAPNEANQVPLFLREKGIRTVCLFQPHVSFRGKTESSDFTALWDNLSRAYGRDTRDSSVNTNGWLVHEGKAVLGWVQHNGWWRAGQRPNLARRSVGDPKGDVRPNRTEDLDALTDNMLRYAYPGFEHNYGLWYDRRRDAHDTGRRDNPRCPTTFPRTALGKRRHRDCMGWTPEVRS